MISNVHLISFTLLTEANKLVYSVCFSTFHFRQYVYLSNIENRQKLKQQQ